MCTSVPMKICPVLLLHDAFSRKWILHVYSLCGTQACMEFMKDKLNTLTEELISSYLITSSYNGNPTELMTKFFKVWIGYL